MAFSYEDKIFDEKFVFEGVHSKEVDRRISCEKLDRVVFNKLFRKLRDTGTVDWRPGSGRPRSEKKIAMSSDA